MINQVLLFYKYVTIEDPERLAARVRGLATKHKLLGRCIVAEEGINGTFEGETVATEAFVKELLEDVRFADMQIKRSKGTGNAFKRLRVKVRDEIVGTHFDKTVDPRKRTGAYIKPEELREWYEKGEDFVVIDMRNDYEYQSGRFKNSVNPGLGNSRDLPQALPKLEQYKDKKVLTVCTGGVRCEKMSAFLLEHGFQNVSQLENGIHSYMEKYPAQDFEGTLYTFDERLVMDFGGERTIVGRCRLCEAPTESYVNCSNDPCHLHFLACESCQTSEAVFCSAECEQALCAVPTSRGQVAEEFVK